MMKQLSLTSINNRAPLEVSLTASGTFTFGSDYNKYIVGFVEDSTIMDSGVYQFFIENVDYSKNSLSTKVYQTYSSLLISNTNPSYAEVLSAFNDFASGFSSKIE